MGDGSASSPLYDLLQLQRNDEQAWREFVITITPRLEARAQAVLSKLGRPMDRAAVDSAVIGAVFRTWEGISKGKITRTPEVRALYYIRKVIDQEYKEATKGGKYLKQAREGGKLDGRLILDYPEYFDPAQDILISRDHTLTKASHFFKDFEKALFALGHHLTLSQEESSRTEVNDPYLQIAALDLVIHDRGSVESQLELLGLNNSVQYGRICDRGWTRVTDQMLESNRRANLFQLVEAVGEIVIDRWARSFVPCFPYIKEPQRLDLDLDGSEQIHRHVHVELLRCESCLSWKNKSRAQVAELEFTQSVIHETMKSIREVTEGSS
jgi:hypothetical protein